MPKRRLGIILQARVGSTRLPEKILMPFAGKPMIQWIIERLQQCRKPDLLIVATSQNSVEEPLVELVESLGIELFRGSEDDVLDRYYQCAKVYGLDDIIRTTGDNPLIDPETCDQIVDFYHEQKLDFAITASGHPRGYPLGVGTEIFSFTSLAKSWHEGIEPHHREHVDEYMLENLTLFKQNILIAPPKLRGPNLSFTVDTQQEFDYLEEIYVDALYSHPNQIVDTSYVIQKQLEIL